MFTRTRSSMFRRIHQAAGFFMMMALGATLGAGCGDTGSSADVSCSDGTKNGSESDIDCGGGTCKPCSDGQSCTDGASCTSGVCTNEKCVPASCSDGVQNADEIKVDCGGHCAKPETCNDLDDDCNGMIDDGVPSQTCGVGACQVTIPGCSKDPCQPALPNVEICDGMIDEDCDGMVDNGCTCLNGTEQSCYSGSPETLDVGRCKVGKQLCDLGMWGNCIGDVTPVSEFCNGLDDDCDGVVDDDVTAVTCGVGACQVTVSGCENGVPPACVPGQPSQEVCNGIDDDCDQLVDEVFPNMGTACSTGLPGVCAAGTIQCKVGAEACEQTAGSSMETCDGLDNDCNGLTDDGDPGGGAACTTGLLGVCATGTLHCSNGVVTCSPNTQASAESCNGFDDDCNGSVDDGLGGTISCGVGACRVTVPECLNGMPATCTPGQSMPETCNGIDDDCDGVIDEGNPGGGAMCNTGQPGVCSTGTTNCQNGSLVCLANTQAGTEVCDGVLDENCNGIIDDGCACANGSSRVCYDGPVGTAGVGPCLAGMQTCVAGAWGACMGQVLPAAESCNGVDDDCSGVIDQGNPGGGQACNTGNLGICAAGTTTCSSGMMTCQQTNQAAGMEDCATPVDDNCNGQVNEMCGICTPFATRSCYSGPVGTAGVGACKSGTQTCNSTGSAWGPCTGEVLPSTESCKNNVDDDCDGQLNEGCAALSCQDFYIEDFNDGAATPLTGVYDVAWCNSYVATAANTPLCMLPGQTTRTNATGGTNAFVGIWVNKETASCSAVRLSYDWYQFASAGAVVEYKQTTDTFSSYSSCSSSLGWTTAVPSTSMSTLQTCSSIVNINIPFGSSPAVYIKFKSTNAQNNAMWWDNIKLTLVGCDC